MTEQGLVLSVQNLKCLVILQKCLGRDRRPDVISTPEKYEMQKVKW